VTDRPIDSAASGAASGGELPRPVADDFQPDIPADAKPDSPARRPSDQRNGDLPGEHARGPAPFDAPRERRGDSSAPGDDVHLVPGARIAGGRYRLLVFHGGAPPLQFWQALDTALDRQVALTFVDPDGALPNEVLQEILARTLRLSRIDKPGVARVLDVIHTGAGGLVVAEWIRGGSLQEVADTAPSPIGAVRAMQSLAAAADAAHRAGVALSIDHPSRVRVSIEGDVVLAYPATMPDANPQDDIRGIGAALYALLVNRWPLAEHGVRSGLAPAERDSSGLPVEPTVIDRDIPFQISAVAVRAVQEDGGIRSASTLLNLLQQATAVADRTEVLGPVDDTPPLPSPREPNVGEYATFARRRRNVLTERAVVVDDGVIDPQLHCCRGRRQTHQGNRLLPRRRPRQPRYGRAGHRRRPLHRLGDRGLHRRRPVPQFQAGRRADLAAAQPDRRRPSHHRHAEHRNQGRDPLRTHAFAFEAGGHHRAGSGVHAQAWP